MSRLGHTDAEPATAVAVGGLPPIALDEVVAEAALQQRVDRKYLVGASQLALALEQVGPALRCLDIGGVRQFGYETVYFDTPDLRCFRDHVQGRRLRAKVRARTYTDSQQSTFEVKATGRRELTVKARMPWSPGAPDVLTREARAFVTAHAPFLAGELLPTGRTTYRRSTLVLEGGGRVTIDVGLQLERAGRTTRLDPGTALVERKTAGPASALDRTLVARGCRPVSISKYCLAIALLEPNTASNPWHRTMRRHFGWTGELLSVTQSA